MATNNIFEEYALGSVLSDSAEMSYNDVMEALESGNIPEDVIVWAPFEYEDPRALASRIEEYHDIFKTFAEELDERRAKGIEK
jgi:hypothetical protein